MLSGTVVFAQGKDDTLWPKQTLRLEVAGKAILGIGITYERAWKNPNRTKHPRAFNSVEVNASSAFLEYIVTSVGINRNWYLGAERKWTLSCGISPGAFICLNPTPKEVREYYDAYPQYSRGRYVNPIEPGLLANVSCRYAFDRMFVQASITPFFHYDRAYNNEFLWAPWAGVSIGINLGAGHTKKSQQQSSTETDTESDTNSE